MKKILGIVALLFCASQLSAQDAWSVLASPIQMQSDTLVFGWQEYFPYGRKLDSIRIQDYKCSWQGPTVKILPNAKAPKLSNASFYIDGRRYDVLVYASRKENVEKVIQLEKACTKLELKGTFSNWAILNGVASPLAALPSKNWKINLKNINQGKHEYKLIADGAEVNPLNEPTVANGMGGTNTVLQVGVESTIKPSIQTSEFQGAKVSFQGSNIDGYFVYWQQNLVQSVSKKKLSSFSIAIPQEATSIQRSYLRVYAYNGGGRSNDILVPLEYGRVINSTSLLTRADLHRQIMYFMMVDRFFNGDSSNDPKPLADVHPKADFMGGDIQGITKKLTDGYFEDLGFNTIWISPIAKNPDGAFGYWNKGITTKFSSYHGYWPSSYTLIDQRFGNGNELSNMISLAHKREMNVVLDFVAHHVHVEHPLYKRRPDWATPLYLPDGSMNTERWDDYRLTTWFDTFLPTLNFENKDVTDVVSDSTALWLRNFDIDGFRHDASKHVPDIFWKTLTYKIRKIQREKGNTPFYQIGETYGSPELIASYVNSGQMDGQFDFNLYDAALLAFAGNQTSSSMAEKSFANLTNSIDNSFQYYGHHHLMGNISGNQDKPRFISMADGSVLPSDDAKYVGWTTNVQVKNTEAYKQLAQMMAFNFSIPGIPVVYYGDEIGMPGANDPDNRRMMKFDGLNQEQIALRDCVQKLCNYRANNLEMIYGDTKVLSIAPGVFAIERNYFGKKSLIIFSKTVQEISFEISESRKLEPQFGSSLEQNKKTIKLKLDNNDFEILQYQ